jgi:hypothetical protein
LKITLNEAPAQTGHYMLTIGAHSESTPDTAFQIEIAIDVYNITDVTITTPPPDAQTSLTGSYTASAKVNGDGPLTSKSAID